MLSWQTHYKIAEKLLEKAEDVEIDWQQKTHLVDRALVHATLAKIQHEALPEPIEVFRGNVLT